MSLKVSCLSIDCPERKGDACQFDADGTLDNLVRDLCRVQPMPKSEARERIKKLIALELCLVRGQYDALEHLAQVDTMESPPRKFVTWRGWKMIRNVITDRVEQLTGDRVGFRQ